MEDRIVIATEYLKSIGCKEVILFGSYADGTADRTSDLDLAVSGISPRTYFRTVAEISSIVGMKVDLVTMDHLSADFKKKIQKEGRRLYAA